MSNPVTNIGVMTAGEGSTSKGPSPGEGGWRSAVGTLAALFLGGVFLAAVWGKMFDPTAFAEVIAVEGLDFWIDAKTFAYLALGVEAAIGLALAFNMRQLWVLIPTAALIVFFMVLNGKAYSDYLHGVQPEMASCGCFGHLVERTPTEAFWQDAILLIPAMILAFVGRPKGGGFPWVRSAVVVVLSIGVTAFAWNAVDLPIDDFPFATRLRPGLEVADICTGSSEDELCLSSPGVAPWLLKGRHVVVIADITDEAFLTFLTERDEETQMSFGDELWMFDADPSTPDEMDKLLILNSQDKEDQLAFDFRSMGAPVRLQMAPRPLLRPLYRKLPRTFVVEDGRVTRTWAELPRDLTELAPAGP